MISTTQRQAIIAGTAEGITLKELGLRGRGEVYVLDGTCVRFITRSSRFLRKDAEGFVAVLAAASSHTAQELIGHVLIEKAPVCSKARRWLEERDVEVETLY